MLADIDKETVDWTDNFDGSLQEPAVLPALPPNLLLNGATGIAVGMATNIPPHNLSELADAIAYLIDRWDERDEVTVDELMELRPGAGLPDRRHRRSGATRSSWPMAPGKGRVIMRAVAHIEEMARRPAPHRRHRDPLPDQQDHHPRAHRRAGARWPLERYQRPARRIGPPGHAHRHRAASAAPTPLKVLNQLYKYTPLQSTFGVNMLALVDGEPRLLNLKRALERYVEQTRSRRRRRSRQHRGPVVDRARHRLRRSDRRVRRIEQHLVRGSTDGLGSAQLGDPLVVIDAWPGVVGECAQHLGEVAHHGGDVQVGGDL